jgi:hypothetical protein
MLHRREARSAYRQQSALLSSGIRHPALGSAACVSIRQHTSAYVSMRHTAPSTRISRLRQHTPAYVSIRQHASYGTQHFDQPPAQHTPAYVSIRRHASACVSIRQHMSAYVSIRQHTSAYVSMRCAYVRAALPLSCVAYVSIRQHTSAYVGIRQHTSAYVSIRYKYATVPQQQQVLRLC